MKKKTTPYPGMTKKEYKKLLKKSKVVLTFANEKYVRQYKSMISEIEEQHRRNAQKVANDKEIIGKGLVRVRKKEEN